MADRYAVIGNPVAHSQSPRIHAAFALQTGQDVAYERVLAPLDGFASTLAQLREAGYHGCNVTVPFKQEAFALATLLTRRASAAGAVNTLSFDADGLCGDNTDGAGLVRDICDNLGVSIQGRQVLLLGAGGAAQGVLQPLLEQHPSCLVIANRSLDKAQALQARSGNACVEACGFAALAGRRFDVAINATSVGLSGDALSLPECFLAPGALAYDMMYGRETAFMAHARVQGAHVADGLGMLVEQAAEAFFVWRGVRPDTAPVIAALRV